MPPRHEDTKKHKEEFKPLTVGKEKIGKTISCLCAFVAKKR